ncbi:OLC1v1015522C1 [Oldenlandia corymbosa var. corymbosa]|uniref:OLC1v1015522C1 n=1 Tax=Oldenlandia corymbosa var. corymbosa TaxID=529605 RepID=A0AAV1E6N8_OLDCO|nr:OLC1v1015522C1 [Oldenlandia corymbosa var. corymbosa]
MAQISLLTEDRGGRHIPLVPNVWLRFCDRTTNIACVIIGFEDEKMGMPGITVNALLGLHLPYPFEVGQTFVLREGGKAGRLVGGGCIHYLLSTDQLAASFLSEFGILSG